MQGIGPLIVVNLGGLKLRHILFQLLNTHPVPIDQLPQIQVYLLFGGDNFLPELAQGFAVEGRYFHPQGGLRQLLQQLSCSLHIALQLLTLLVHRAGLVGQCATVVGNAPLQFVFGFQSPDTLALSFQCHLGFVQLAAQALALSLGLRIGCDLLLNFFLLGLSVQIPPLIGLCQTRGLAVLGQLTLNPQVDISSGAVARLLQGWAIASRIARVSDSIW